MRVAIAGAGAVGRSIAGELLENGHEVLLIDKNSRAIKVYSVPRAEWLLADACEISSLDDASLERCNVVIAATGDDKVNLVVSLLASLLYLIQERRLKSRSTAHRFLPPERRGGPVPFGPVVAVPPEAGPYAQLAGWLGRGTG